MDVSTLFLIIVFALGVSVGGLMVSLQRQCSMARIKGEFEQQLRAAMKEQRETEGKAGVKVHGLEQGKQAAALIEEEFDPEPPEEAYPWGHVTASDSFRVDTHAPV